ncbi:hypothetical protein PIB30_049905 [Stylosanthes scabra]|uniref:Reverse transcriptase domain-containing protein n=1 Tax=Stylosanthes scabra TaxID=79078 RepID=A0ABU6YJY5_9FABA|nr:hypothetical protein [Stylosanthes scabra]
MVEDPGAPLILGRPFLATSRALIDMEKDVKKQDPPDKPSQDHPLWKTVKEELSPSLNKAEIKRNKSGVAQASCTDKFPQIQITSKAPYHAISVCHNKQKLTADASPMKIDPP